MLLLRSSQWGHRCIITHGFVGVMFIVCVFGTDTFIPQYYLAVGSSSFVMMMVPGGIV